MAGFHLLTMPRPQPRTRPATPVVDITLVRPWLTEPAPEAPVAPSPYGRRMTADQREHARRRTAEGWSIAAIAAELGFGATAISHATRGIDRAAGPAMVAARRAAREEMQAEVRLLKSRGLSDGEVARRVKTTVSNVRKLKVSPKEYEKYLAKSRKDSVERNKTRNKASRGLRRNFLDNLAGAVQAATGVGLDEMKMPAADQLHSTNFVRAHQILCWLAVKQRGYPQERVAMELGIDPGTVRGAIATVQAAAETVDLPYPRPVHPVVVVLMDAMRRRALRARRPEIPPPERGSTRQGEDPHDL